MSPNEEGKRKASENSAQTRRVEVLPYDPAWPIRFEEIQAHLRGILFGQDVRVEHVGSTSVPGLAAKPIIDIDIVLQNGATFEAVKTSLEANGYTHVGDFGITGREVFKYDDKPQLMSHHLYALSADSEELKRHLTFRDWLRSHPQDRAAYAQAKLAAARQFPNDIDAYIDAKSGVIFDIYTRCGLYQPQDLPVLARSVLSNRYDLRVGDLDYKPLQPGIMLFQAKTEHGTYYLLSREHAGTADDQNALNLGIADLGIAMPIPTASGLQICNTPMATFALFGTEQDALTFLSSNLWS